MVATTLPPEYYLNDINAYTNEIETVKKYSGGKVVATIS